MLVKIDRGAPTPIHRQILEGIKALIENGTLAAGQALPPSRGLARQIGVNRSTVYQAYAELQAQGYLLSRPGSYNTVQARRKEVAYDPRRRGLIDWDRASTENARKVYRANLALQAARRPARTPAAPEEKAAVDFASLEVDPRLYPLAEFRSVMSRVLLEAGPEAFRYGHPQGYAPLRAGIARRLRLHGISVSANDVLVTSGSQQGLDLITRLLCPPGSRIAVECPTYARFLPLLELNGAKPVAVPMTAAGMDLDALEKVLAAGGIRFIYTMPNFQNPTGITTAHPHRERLLTLALKHKTPILEDGFEEDMKYFGKVPLPLKSIDEHGIVIYLGTFSKALFSGLRIGWITADRDGIERLTAVKRFSDLSTSALTQIAIDRFCRLGLYDLHLKRIHRVYRRRLQLTLQEMDRHMPKGVEWTRPAGGYTLWVKMARPVGAEELRGRLARFGVAVTPGAEFFPGGGLSRHFRLCIAKPDEAEIGDGIRRLGKALAALPAGAKERS
jgi:GntR family transcriptional regulator/MocR family aminotransferase